MNQTKEIVPFDIKDMNQTKEIVPFDIEELIENNIALLQEQCEEMVIDEKGKGYVEVKAAHVKVKGLKRAVTDRHKELKAESLEYGQRLDAERRRLFGLLDPIIDILAQKRQVEDDRRAEIRDAKNRIEQDRINGIRVKIDGIKQWCYQGLGHKVPSDDIKRLVALLETTRLNLVEADYMEFLGEAQDLLWDAIVKTEEALESRLQQEKEEVERKAEDARLAKIKKQQEAEQEKIDAAKREIEKEKTRIEQAERDRKIKEEAEIQAKADAEKQIQEARGAQIKAEVEAKEAKDRAKREVEQERIAKEAEQVRIEALKPDIEKLSAFAQYLENIAWPVLKDAEMVKVLNSAKAFFSKAVEVIRKA